MLAVLTYLIVILDVCRLILPRFFLCGRNVITQYATRRSIYDFHVPSVSNVKVHTHASDCHLQCKLTGRRFVFRIFFISFSAISQK